MNKNKDSIKHLKLNLILFKKCQLSSINLDHFKVKAKFKQKFFIKTEAYQISKKHFC